MTVGCPWSWNAGIAQPPGKSKQLCSTGRRLPAPEFAFLYLTVMIEIVIRHVTAQFEDAILPSSFRVGVVV